MASPVNWCRLDGNDKSLILDIDQNGIRRFFQKAGLEPYLRGT